MEPTKNIQKKIKILALHGFAQSSSIFKTRISALEKTFKKKKEYEIEILYPQGPHKVPPPGDNAPQDQEYFGWLTMQDWQRQFQNSEASFEGFQESYSQVIEPILKQNDDINVIIGFSQGALFATMLQAHIIANKQQHLLKNLKTVILAAGVGSPVPNNYPQLEDFTKKDKRINVNSMHIMGETDEFIPVWRSERLQKWYKDEQAIIEKHPGKHCLPQNSSWNNKYFEFIVNNIQNESNDYTTQNQE